MLDEVVSHGLDEGVEVSGVDQVVSISVASWRRGPSSSFPVWEAMVFQRGREQVEGPWQRARTRADTSGKAACRLIGRTGFEPVPSSAPSRRTRLPYGPHPRASASACANVSPGFSQSQCGCGHGGDRQLLAADFELPVQLAVNSGRPRAVAGVAGLALHLRAGRVRDDHPARSLRADEVFAQVADLQEIEAVAGEADRTGHFALVVDHHGDHRNLLLLERCLPEPRVRRNAPQQDGRGNIHRSGRGQGSWQEAGLALQTGAVAPSQP